MTRLAVFLNASHRSGLDGPAGPGLGRDGTGQASFADPLCVDGPGQAGLVACSVSPAPAAGTVSAVSTAATSAAAADTG